MCVTVLGSFVLCGGVNNEVRAVVNGVGSPREKEWRHGFGLKMEQTFNLFFVGCLRGAGGYASCSPGVVILAVTDADGRHYDMTFQNDGNDGRDGVYSRHVSP